MVIVVFVSLDGHRLKVLFWLTCKCGLVRGASLKSVVSLEFVYFIFCGVFKDRVCASKLSLALRKTLFDSSFFLFFVPNFVGFETRLETSEKRSLPINRFEK